MKLACPRLFEVEAWRDGRLSGVEAERFRAHLELCASCTREMQSLDALGKALCAPLPEADELHVRRERTRLLAAFDARLVPRSQKWNHAGWLLAAATALLLSAVAVTTRTSKTASGPSSANQPAPPAEAIVVRADPSARWSRRQESEFETIRLESGELSIRVDHAASERRLRVLLPDGELEDIGTTFSVSADSGRTTRVSVQAGRVVLRVRGAPSLTLSAGDSWSLQASLPSSPPSEAPSAALVPAVRSAEPAAVRASARAREPDASLEFRAAMAALDRGDNGQAATLFGDFLSRHPGDSHAEDAAYLRVLALQRAGNSSATQGAARDYVTRYPGGFRKAEIERLAQP